MIKTKEKIAACAISVGIEYINNDPFVKVNGNYKPVLSENESTNFNPFKNEDDALHVQAKMKLNIEFSENKIFTTITKKTTKEIISSEINDPSSNTNDIIKGMIVSSTYYIFNITSTEDERQELKALTNNISK